jgi:hypothetical protein
VLAAAGGLKNKEIASKRGICTHTVGTWRNRFAEREMDGLYDEPRPGAWQAAMEALLLVVENSGPPMFARIGVMRVLNRNVERVFNPSRNDTHWGKQKLKRDE